MFQLPPGALKQGAYISQVTVTTPAADRGGKLLLVLVVTVPQRRQLRYEPVNKLGINTPRFGTNFKPTHKPTPKRSGFTTPTELRPALDSQRSPLHCYVHPSALTVAIDREFSSMGQIRKGNTDLRRTRLPHQGDALIGRSRYKGLGLKINRLETTQLRNPGGQGCELKRPPQSGMGSKRGGPI